MERADDAFETRGREGASVTALTNFKFYVVEQEVFMV